MTNKTKERRQVRKSQRASDDRCY